MEENNNLASIEATPNGSYKATNIKILKNAKGESLETKEVMWLCRCGHSANKPFCDGAHKKIGFRDP